MTAFPELRLSLATVDGERRLTCHYHPDRHVALRIPRGVTALCAGCTRPLLLCAWTAQGTDGVWCGSCHNRHHGWTA